MTNKVSIIVPCYDQAQYLNECLQSVLEQSYAHWECIVVNDGSPDDMETLAKSWLDKDTRFKYVYQENGGLSSARNCGISHASGEFILPLDADDKISKEYVSLAIKAFVEDDSLKVVYCKAEKFGVETGIWELAPFSLFNLSRENMIFCSALFQKNDWEQVGGYDPNMKCGCEDWEFWIALLKNGGNVKQLNEVGFYYRTKTISMIKEVGNKQYDYLFSYLSVKHADFFVNYFGSFFALEAKITKAKKIEQTKLNSQKFVIDVFCQRFFGFTIFGLYKKEL
ncbi:glycosyltransferase family 2 protein [Flavobacterium degerlachei]|jgi:glycosyltransferase involved in cell wall biosynthesis|uniref:Glycosyltransferase involved in cell wall bisynthesis n=1 Tax=Flavobacterium degerlachei TaxID=229203 RepID=A0A1H2VVM2_9FLAO|nr:glycosyltransferase family A protein [Flavobacterium degerlachei]SDW71929.1 Glycosyltransferase involved in cell wall bisynthesis [Flavobacterium degerlachei]